MTHQDPRQHHNVGGIPGLHVVTDFFSEEVERRLFFNTRLFHTVDDSAAFGRKRHSALTTSQPFLPDDLAGIMNGIVDSGFYDELIMQPSYVLPWTYGPGASFKVILIEWQYKSRFFPHCPQHTRSTMIADIAGAKPSSE